MCVCVCVCVADGVGAVVGISPLAIEMVGDKNATDCSLSISTICRSLSDMVTPISSPSLCALGLSPLPPPGCAGWLSEKEQTGAL